MNYIHRQIEKVLLELVESFSSVAVTGPRQSGKSTLLKNLLVDYKYISLDDPLVREQALSDPSMLLDGLGKKIIVDEIQYAPSILSYIKMRIDSERQSKGYYVFTGSQQFSMIKNLGDSLAGRVALLDLLPFSVDERKKCQDIRDDLDAFVGACLSGSWPELATDESISRTAWYGSYLQTYIERDVRSLYNIGNLRDFQRFLQLLAVRCSQALNMSVLAREIGISVSTIRNWISVLEAGRLIYLLQPFYDNLGKRIVKSPKIYFTDCGLVCYLTGIKDRDHLLQGPMAGALFENFCVQELLKIFSERGQRPNMFYLRTNNDLEVDLLIELSYDLLIPVEIKLSGTPVKKMSDGIERFWKLYPQKANDKGMVACLTKSDQLLRRGIEAVSFSSFVEKMKMVLIY